MMGSRFDQYSELASTATTGVMGQTAVITPRVGGLYATPGADPDRAAFEIDGIFSLAPKNSRIAGQKVGGELSGATRIKVAPAEFWISKSEYERVAQTILEGDLLVLKDDPTGPRYAVNEAEPTDTGDWNVILTREGV